MKAKLLSVALTDTMRLTLRVLAVRDGRIAALRPLADGAEADVAVGILRGACKYDV